MASPQDIIDAGLATVAAEYEISMIKSEEVKTVEKNRKHGTTEERSFRPDGTVLIDNLEIDDGDETEKDDNEGTYYICQVCAKPFDSKKDVELHLRSQECKGMEKEVKEMYECGECKVLCSSMNSLASHMMVHKQKVIVVRHGLNEHLTRVGYTCTTCHKVFCSKGNLAKHQIIHMGVKPYKCSFCNKEFSLKGNRDKHEMIHSDKRFRAHQCQICSKTFTLKGNLQQHILTHSTVKFFRCYLCSKEFTLKGNLDKHIKRHANGLPVQRVTNKVELSQRAAVSSEGNEDGKQQTASSVASLNIKIGNIIGSLKAKLEQSDMDTDDFDELAEGEEMNEYVKGVVIDSDTAEEHVVESQLDSEDNENEDIVQNL